MRERVEELGRGNFKLNIPEIELSTPLIEININKDECFEGHFSLKSLNTGKMKGMIYTSTDRMKCMNSQFIGTEAKILFRFHAKGLCEGKTVKGRFYIISNGGEFRLPFVVNINQQEITSSMGRISNLFHFTNLAATNWQEAFEVFKMPEFTSVFINNDKRYENLYQALTSGEQVTEQCMEEFLIGIHKKSPISLQMNETNKSVYGLKTDEKEAILLTKNTWGYIDSKVTTDCDFIELAKGSIKTENFIGNNYSLEYIIRKDKLHAGKNCGRIKISNINKESVYEITVFSEEKEEESRRRQNSKERKESIFELCKLYISYRCRRTNTNPWVKECMGYVNTLLALEPDNKEYILLRAHLFTLQKKSHEAHELVKDFEKNKKEFREDSRLYAYYLYLTTYWTKDIKYTKKVTDEIRGIYHKQKDWRILWVLLYLDSALLGDSARKLAMMEEQYNHRGGSPIMYVEAYRIIKADVFPLQKLGKFELQVLFWAVKNKVLSKEVTLQTVELAAKVKEFNPLLLHILIYGYGQYHDKTILSAICRLLIQGNRTDTKYFKWYSLGVEQDVRITRLFEYYMYSIPMDYKENIPKSVLMYFDYYNNLDYKKSALLYEKVIKQRDIYPELFQNYRRHIEEFMMEQLMAKRNSEKLAFIYDAMLSLNSITPELAGAIAEIIFGCELECKNSKIKSVSVIHKHLKKEKIYPITEQKAYIQLYTKDYAVSFLDGEGNRYQSSVDYEIKYLMDEAFYIKKCFDFDVKNKNVRLNVSQNLISGSLIQEEHLELLEEILQEKEVKEEYKAFLRGVVINYCYEHDEDSLEKHIINMEWGKVECLHRTKAIEYLIMKGVYEQAYEGISQYGHEDISVKQLIKLTSRLIFERDYEKDELLLSMADSVFKEKKYDEIILRYLILYFNGTLGEMRNIWAAANKFDVDAYELSERIILQILFTNEYLEEIDDIFDYYYSKGPKTQIAQAFLTYYAYLFFVSDRRVGKKTFEYIKREQYIEGMLNDTCRLAMLKYYARCLSLTGEEKEYVKSTLQEFISRKMYFKFYEEFGEEMLAPYCYAGKCLVEHKTDMDHPVFIHYIQEDMAGNGQYKVEKMQQSYPGIHHKLFTVFYGEKIQYYITEESDSKELVRSDTIVKSEMNLNNSCSRYNMLNDMSVAIEMNDDATLLELMNKYAVNSQAAALLFKSM
ncbi:DUF5717 family protein [Konateibacter massiliensis]|uniref:DUF5717 family protein n=1 Tax=Konateibacter massiliensis TaxID=2002841 RepID=UPI00117B13B6|nr:DUF5717 family protein [Konateibacter massiliensis]